MTEKPANHTHKPRRYTGTAGHPLPLGNVADLSKEEIAKRRLERRLVGLGDREVLRLWYHSEEPWELTERQDWLRKRWDFAKAQFLKRKRFTDIKRLLVEEFGISDATAAIDIRHALDVFGELDRVPKEAHRQRAIDMALKAYKTAEKEKNSEAMTAATKMYYLATGLDKDDPDRIDMEKLMQDRTYAEVLDPAIRDLLLNFLEQAGGSLDVSRLFETIYAAKNGEYTSYEEVSDDAGTDQV